MPHIPDHSRPFRPKRKTNHKSFPRPRVAEAPGSAFSTGLLVTGQQRLEESDETHVLGKLEGRFKQKLRVHLGATDIRDVVDKRLLHKTTEGEAWLRDKFRAHRNDLKLFAYGCEAITEEDFEDVRRQVGPELDQGHRVRLV